MDMNILSELNETQDLLASVLICSEYDKIIMEKIKIKLHNIGRAVQDIQKEGQTK